MASTVLDHVTGGLCLLFMYLYVYMPGSLLQYRSCGHGIIWLLFMPCALFLFSAFSELSARFRPLWCFVARASFVAVSAAFFGVLGVGGLFRRLRPCRLLRRFRRWLNVNLRFGFALARLIFLQGL